MKRVSIILFTLITGLLLIAPFGVSVASAQSLTSAQEPLSTLADFIPACAKGQPAYGTPVCSDVQQQNKSQGNILIHIIKDVIDILSFIVGVAAVIILIISAITMITSGGDSNSVAGARRGILGAVIGIMVVALAQSIVVFVLDKIK